MSQNVIMVNLGKKDCNKSDESRVAMGVPAFFFSRSRKKRRSLNSRRYEFVLNFLYNNRLLMNIKEYLKGIINILSVVFVGFAYKMRFYCSLFSEKTMTAEGGPCTFYIF